MLCFVLIQALNKELVSVDRQMSDIVTICEALIPELTDDDQDRAKAAVNDRSSSTDRYNQTSLICLPLSY